MLTNGAVVPVAPQPMPSVDGKSRWSTTVVPTKSGGALPNGVTKPITFAASPAAEVRERQIARLHFVVVRIGVARGRATRAREVEHRDAEAIDRRAAAA